MRPRILAGVGILLLSAMIAARAIRARHERPQAAGEDGARGEEGAAEAGDPKGEPGNGTSAANSKPGWRGLRLLEGAGPPPAGEHPWTSYAKSRDAALKAWADARVTLDLTHGALTDLTGAVGAAAGLVLRVDPACARLNLGLFRFDNEPADAVLARLRGYEALRVTVGSDGVVWIVPRAGRAACEPDFVADLGRWEQSLQAMKAAPQAHADNSHILAAMKEKRARVELVRVPVAEAARILTETYGVRVEDRRAGPPKSDTVTVVRESATLEEVLQEMLPPLDLGTFVDSQGVEIHSRSDLDEWLAAEKEGAARLAGTDLLSEDLGRRIVRLHGSPLTPDDLASEAAKQAGLGLRLDPLLRSSPARWEAVDAELTLGELLREMERGADCQCRVRAAGWPDALRPAEPPELWVVTRRALGLPR